MTLKIGFTPEGWSEGGGSVLDALTDYTFDIKRKDEVEGFTGELVAVFPDYAPTALVFRPLSKDGSRYEGDDLIVEADAIEELVYV